MLLSNYTAAVTQLLSFFVLIADLLLLLAAAALLAGRFSKRSFPWLERASWFLKSNGLKLAFLVALSATLGSLFYSEIAGFTPCKLCWFQRIFMYPQVIILGVALWKKTRDVADYVIALSLIGAVIAVYHYSLQWQQVLAPCSLDSPSCGVRYAFHFGYITIPMMALTAFLLIIILALVAKVRPSSVK